ncbi:hypothetical protein GOP47_0016444 [Adiantum capillus-veneris]|uniref:Peptidyl-prolyl cis-trans isomerase n=1 Tax=Adiantum capillus-veneris TaxID=13818 RepID=A0A9D4UIH8_ADICA|nr:hypothetical protein GOP47_0016444 [Adiantum capillus-veneris]
MTKASWKLSSVRPSLGSLRHSSAITPIVRAKFCSVHQNSTFNRHTLVFSSGQRPAPTLRSTGIAVFCRAASSMPVAESDRERLIQHLLVPAEKLTLLLELQRQTQQGSDLSDLATEHSICPSKKDGGMLGWVRKGQMVSEFQEAAFNAPLNKIIRVKTKFGWHLVQSLSEREAAFLQDIQPEELRTLLQDPGFLEEAQLVDVREPNEISIAAIEGFKAYPLSQFGQWGPQIAAVLDSSKDTYLLCHHGVRSLQAGQWLQTQGFRRLYNVAGGIHQYSLRADKDIPTY